MLEAIGRAMVLAEVEERVGSGERVGVWRGRSQSE
jgi:hypothetical protein